jgi:hypothetical protein
MNIQKFPDTSVVTHPGSGLGIHGNDTTEWAPLSITNDIYNSTIENSDNNPANYKFPKR